jgi:hypothetical protein
VHITTCLRIGKLFALLVCFITQALRFLVLPPQLRSQIFLRFLLVNKEPSIRRGDIEQVGFR